MPSFIETPPLSIQRYRVMRNGCVNGQTADGRTTDERHTAKHNASAYCWGCIKQFDERNSMQVKF